MFGSTIINQRQHVGLQKLSALSGLATQFLGPTKTYKFIQDDATGESTLVSSCHRALENLELTCAVGHLVYETIEAHHKIYKTGSGCLLFMAGAWSRAALECLHQGIPIREIVSAMAEGLDICLRACEQYKITFQEFHATSNPTNDHLLNKGALKDFSNHQVDKRQRKLKLSRHFRDPKFEEATPSSLLHHTCSEKSKLADIARTLSHGCSDTMNLVVKASEIQMEQGITLDVAKMSTCLLPGPTEDNACVLPGCIALASSEQTIVAHNLEGQDLKLALIDGDLSSTFRHLGYYKPKGLKRVIDFPSSECEDEDWLERVVRLLLNLQVNVLLIRGVANEKLKCRLWRHDILIVENVKLSVLKTFAISTGAILVSYATQLTSKCIGSSVYVHILEHFGNKSKCETALNISTNKNDGLVTVLLTSCVHGKLQSLEDSFWACASRLYWALQDKSLLPGSGVTEMICVRQLQKQAQLYERNAAQVNPKTAAGHYIGVVLQLMADGFLDFISSVMVNTGRYSKVEARTVVAEKLHDWDDSANCVKFSQMSLEEGQGDDRAVSDNFSLKQEVWRKALDLVFLVLQTDAEVITGVDQQSSEQRDLVFL